MIKRCLSALALTVVVVVAAPRLAAQASYTATGKALAVGISYQNIDPDYGPSRASGVGLFANYDFSRFIGATAEVNFQTAFSNVVYKETTYMVGPRGFYNVGRYSAYGKILIGGANGSNNTNNPALLNVGSYGALAIGGGLDVRFQRHITWRVIDYEDQHWLGYNPNSLTPHVFSFGVAYRFQ